MKNKIIYILTLIAANSYAGAKLSIKPQFFTESHKMGVTSGVSVYQKIKGPVAVNLWAGLGYRPEPIDANWYGVNADVDVQFSSFTISPGFQYRASPKAEDKDNSIGVKFTQKLW